MRLLLDTHVFLWYITADSRLPAPFLGAIRDPTNEVYCGATARPSTMIRLDFRFREFHHAFSAVGLAVEDREIAIHQRQAQDHEPRRSWRDR